MIDIDFQKLYEDDSFGYYNPEEDNFSTMSLAKTRQKKLTLSMVNRLKKIRKTKRAEMSVRGELIGAMYGIPREDDSGI